MARADYGIDAPSVVRNFVLIALAGGVALAVSLLGLAPVGLLAPLRSLGWTALFTGVPSALIMVLGSKVVKLGVRDRLLDELQLKGEERVLDVGCGRGLLLIGAAKRLPRGRAVGVDLWQTVDQSGNHPDTTRANAEAEGVLDRIEIHTADMRKLPFEDASMDAVVSSWAIHNIPDETGRRQAIREIWRVLKPGGRLVCIDIQRSAEYVDELKKLGASGVSRRGPNLLFVIPSFTVRVTRSVT